MLVFLVFILVFTVFSFLFSFYACCSLIGHAEPLVSKKVCHSFRSFIKIESLLRLDKTVSRLARRRFSQQTNEWIFCFFILHGKKKTQIRLFIFGGRIYGAQICLRFYLTFRVLELAWGPCEQIFGMICEPFWGVNIWGWFCKGNFRCPFLSVF